jgi:outer membrane protein TolC
VEAERDVRTTRFRLFELLGAQEQAADSLDLSLATPQPPPSDARAALTQGIGRRYEVQAALAAVDEARKRVDVARLTSAARLDLQSDYLQRTPTGVMQGQQWNVGVGLSVPLVDAGLTRLRTRQATLVLDDMAAGLAQVERLARLEVSSLYEDMRARFQDLQTSLAAYDSAREAARVSRIRYHNGLCTALELQDAEASLSDADGRCVRARRAYAISWVHWRRASGAAATQPPPSTPSSTRKQVVP